MLKGSFLAGDSGGSHTEPAWPPQLESGQGTCFCITHRQQDLQELSLRLGPSKPARDSRHNSVIQMGEEFDSYANDFYL